MLKKARLEAAIVSLSSDSAFECVKFERLIAETLVAFGLDVNPDRVSRVGQTEVFSTVGGNRSAQAVLDDAALMEAALTRDESNEPLTLKELAAVANQMFPDSKTCYNKGWAIKWWNRVKTRFVDVGLHKTVTIDEKTLENYKLRWSTRGS
jgi:hypothetical protein